LFKIRKKNDHFLYYQIQFLSQDRIIIFSRLNDKFYMFISKYQLLKCQVDLSLNSTITFNTQKAKGYLRVTLSYQFRIGFMGAGDTISYHPPLNAF